MQKKEQGKKQERHARGKDLYDLHAKQSANHITDRNNTIYGFGGGCKDCIGLSNNTNNSKEGLIKKFSA